MALGERERELLSSYTEITIIQPDGSQSSFTRKLVAAVPMIWRSEDPKNNIQAVYDFNLERKVVMCFLKSTIDGSMSAPGCD